MVYPNKKALIQKWSGSNNVVLDIGFWGQGKNINETNAPHVLLKQYNKTVYGIDPVSEIVDELYSRQSAEDFTFDITFDSIWSLDLIEHLSNQGLYLDNVRKYLKEDGKLIISTPNCFNFFNFTEKITKYEPTTNREHTCYYNHRTLKQLLERHGFEIIEQSYVYSLEYSHKESFKKKILNKINRFLSFFTDKYSETLAVIAQPKK
ncbi:MAG: class I SAM-dependent methyltransferase [bacterium]|nr:class I SAM-dependent methyltransferase [bacterium]